MQDSNNTQTSTIMPVYVSPPNDSSKEILVYALLDSQSDSSFLRIFADALDMDTEQAKLRLSTMTSKKTAAKAWPHLVHLAEHIALQMECEISLLIGYNWPQALMPREVVIGEENQPFAQKTDLGWSIVELW